MVGRLHKKSGMRKHTRRKMVLPAGIVRSAATEQRLFAARRNRVTLFRRPRREYKRDRVCVSIPGENGTPGGNRTHNGPLGGGCYIHLTTEAYETNDIPADFRRVSAETPKGVPSAECRFARANPQRPRRCEGCTIH